MKVGDLVVHNSSLGVDGLPENPYMCGIIIDTRDMPYPYLIVWLENGFCEWYREDAITMVSEAK